MWFSLRAVLKIPHYTKAVYTRTARRRNTETVKVMEVYNMVRYQNRIVYV